MYPTFAYSKCRYYMAIVTIASISDERGPDISRYYLSISCYGHYYYVLAAFTIVIVAFTIVKAVFT